jgi:AraC-like DNA-binding protein
MHSIRLIKPALPLRGYVRFYAQRTVRIDDDVVVHPITARAAPLLEFIFGDRIEVVHREKQLRQTSPRAVIVGMQTGCRADLELRGRVDCFVIMFQPTGLHRLFSIPMYELTDRNYEAQAVVGAWASNLEQRLGECLTPEERVRIADEFLLQRALRAPGVDGTSAAAREMLLSGGNLRISPLAGELGMSMRQFERGFMRQVGMRPKLYARIARFEAALDSKAGSSAKSWTDVAHEFGYYDQMHMVHDFEDFTGESPTGTLSHLEALFRGQLGARRIAGRVAVDSRFIL